MINVIIWLSIYIIIRWNSSKIFNKSNNRKKVISEKFSKIDFFPIFQNFPKKKINFPIFLAVETELENSRYEIEALRRSTLPENLAHLSQKLSEMEKERFNRDKRMQKALTSADPEMNRMIADQTDTILKLKQDLTSKNNQFNR